MLLVSVLLVLLQLAVPDVVRADDADDVEFFKQGQLLLVVLICVTRLTGGAEIILLASCCFAFFDLVALFDGPLLDDHLSNVALSERHCADPSAI